MRGFWIWCLLYSIEENRKEQWENGIWFGNTSKRCRRLHSDRTWGIYTGNGSNIILSSDQTEAAPSRRAEKTWKWIRKQEYGGRNKMKKNELAKKSRKLFSAILAGAMLTTSAIPESFVWAADVEEVQGFGDSESMGFESTPDPVTGDGEAGENQEISDFQGASDIQNGNDMVEMEEGFTDEIASFGSNDSDTPVESGFQSLESVEELQERINALPTVEEFQNLADGTTVEGSTLNQAQTDVYAEAQDIVEKLDLLSEDEQGLVDVSRLEALFGYFNGMTENWKLQLR